MSPSDSHRSRHPKSASRPRPSLRWVSRFTDHLPDVPCPLPRRIEWVHMSITSPSVRPSPITWRVGIRDVTFEACSGFTSCYGPPGCSTTQGGLCHEASIRPVTQPNRSSVPDLSTIIWVNSSSTGYPCLFGAHKLSGDKPPSTPGKAPRANLTRSNPIVRAATKRFRKDIAPFTQALMLKVSPDRFDHGPGAPVGSAFDYLEPT